MIEEKGPNMGQFNNVDASDETERFINFLEWIENVPLAAELRKRTYEILDVRSGDSVIDAGCGAGKSVWELTNHGVKAIGIDISKQMIKVACQRFPNCDFRVADVTSLPFEDSSIDYYRAERLYQHLNNPAKALAEAKRILIPGGRILLVDQDYDMWAIDADDETLTRTIMRIHADSICNRWIGRRYSNLLLDSGFIQVTIEVKTLVFTDYTQVAPVLSSIARPALDSGRVTAEQIDFWLKEQEQRGKQKRFFVAMPLFIANGIKP